MIEKLQALFNKKIIGLEKWDELGPVNIQEFINMFNIKFDCTQPIDDKYGQKGTGVNIFRRAICKDRESWLKTCLIEAFWTD